MSSSNFGILYKLIIACTSSILFLPMGLYCIYLIIFRVYRIKSKKLIMLVLCLLILYNFCLPLNRIFYYEAILNNYKERYFLISAFAGSITISAGSIAIWLFSIKMWALAHHMITLMSG